MTDQKVDATDPRIKPGARFKTVVEGIPLIVEIDEVILVDEEKQEAVLKTHSVGLAEEI